MKRKCLPFLLLWALFVVGFVSGCAGGRAGDSFDSITNDLFLYEVKSDSLTLNYTLAKPEEFGIREYAPTFGNYGEAAAKEDLAYYENVRKKLKALKFDALTDEQKFTYEVLSRSLQSDLAMSDYLYYMEALGPTTGVQAQLPILLAEYRFHTKADIDHYIGLLGKLPDYFDQILTFEREKSEKGLFMNDATVDAILSQCGKFIEQPERNLLIEVFDDRMSEYEGLSGEEAESYRTRNKEAVLQSVIPAYEALMEGLSSLKGTGKNAGGLSNLPQGKEYYETLVEATTGSSKSVGEIEELLQDTIKKSQAKLSTTMRKSPDAVYEAMSPSYPLEEPEEILTYLKTAISKDFPAIGAVDCSVKYVHHSLEDDLSPAFYLNPALDEYNENCIYINNGKLDGSSSLFTTLAHEGYPGHLYQSVYFNQQNPPYIRNVLYFGGYSEGWATYVELYSYSVAGLDEATRTLLENNLIATLCVYAQCDIGINYHGWSLEDTAKYLEDFGIAGDEAATGIFETMVAEPANYMKYTLGYLEFEQLKAKAQDKLGEGFVLKDFHEFLLKTGPSWFDLLEGQMDAWITREKQK